MALYNLADMLRLKLGSKDLRKMVTRPAWEEGDMKAPFVRRMSCMLYYLSILAS
jgi:hypothetical protein